ncbi:ABC transporter permease [Barrientosiimonas marina]|uniref:Putative hemin transport system permease protein HrtB n=1 Tax=Lentibacillus kimchii TaxID=1542911 RepID=A0ABW2USZ6_9BACI
MFLAWKEIKYNKLRYALIMGILVLVSYLVFVLSGLANGLEQLNREAVDKWDADGIVLTKESDKRLPRSTMNEDTISSDMFDESAAIGQLSAIASDGDHKSNVSLLGLQQDAFIAPDVTKGKAFAKEGEVIADDSLLDEGFSIGDELNISSSDETLTITGLTDNARFNAAPALYTDFGTMQHVRSGEVRDSQGMPVNGFVVRDDHLDDVSVADDALEVVGIPTFIENLPGYTAQNLTLTFMIYFLFIICAVILAIFLYVLTIQKISMFGVMKAQGIPGRYLANSVIIQTSQLALAGVVTGFLLTIVTGFFLPSAVPIQFDYLTMLLYGMVLIAVSIVGTFISVRTIAKINPLQAIGG